MQRTGQPRLPLELILHICDSLTPDDGVLLPASDPVTRTFVSLSQVCRALYTPAARALRQRCMVLDSASRLASLLAQENAIPRVIVDSVGLDHITRLYLAPFGPQMYDLETAKHVRELLDAVGETLRSLVIDMPFNFQDASQEMLDAKRILRPGLAQLSNLEEFVAIRHYPAVSLLEETTDIWALWPKLQRLALPQVPLSSHWLWWNIATLESLHHVVLISPLATTLTNVKGMYFTALPPHDKALEKQLRLLLLDWDVGAKRPRDTTDWRRHDPNDLMSIAVQDVRSEIGGARAATDTNSALSGWVRQKALDGTLWDVVGHHIPPS